MIQNTIKLGLSINNYTYDENLECLYFDGTAIESGTWTGIGGVPFFFPKEVLIKASSLFNNKPLVCEHRGLVIGLVKRTEPTELGFKIAEGIITHRESIAAVLSGQKLGLSIEGVMTCDDVRLIVEEIVEAHNISLVANPACKVCGIEHIYIDDSKSNKGKLAMSEVTEESVIVEDDDLVDLDSVITSSKDTGEMVTSDPVESVEEADMEVKEEVEVTSENSVDISPVNEISPMTEATPPAEASVALSTEETISQEGVPSTSSINYDTDISELKLALSSATSTIEAVSIQLQDASVKIKELEVALSSSDSKLITTEAKLSSVLSENEQFKQTITELNAQIKSIEEAERNKIISEIKEFDPEVDMNFIDSMTTIQLSSYKSSISKFVKAEKKSVKVDEQVKLSAISDAIPIELDRHEVASGIIPFLSKQQRTIQSKRRS